MEDDGWVMGALASQDNYQPVEKPWQTLDAQLERSIVPDDRMPFGVTTPQEEAIIAPKRAAGVESLVPQVVAPAEAGFIDKMIKPVIKAFHSSPHDFDKFKDVGRTGEGARMITEGSYFSENPAVSGRGGQYWNQFMHRFEGTPEAFAAGRLRLEDWDHARALKRTEDDVSHWREQVTSTDPDVTAYAKKMLATREAEAELLRRGGPVGPRTYEVDIHADPNDMLKWDRPLTEQQHLWDRVEPNVKEAIDDIYDQRGYNVMSDVPEDYTGRDFYKALRHHEVQESLPAVLPGSNLLKGPVPTDAQHATAYLESLGIPGVRYLDAGSRGTPPLEVLQEALAREKRLLAEPEKHLYMPSTSPADKITIEDRVHGRIKSLEDKIANYTAPTYNYVVHPTNLDLVKIMKKYAVPGTLGGSIMGGVAAQDKYEQ